MVKKPKPQDDKFTKGKQQKADDFDIIGDQLWGYMRDERLSGSEVARLCGCAPSTISQIINHQKKPKFPTIKRICKGLDITADYLFGLDDIPNASRNNKVSQKTTGLSSAAIDKLAKLKEAQEKNEQAKTIISGLNLLLTSAAGRQLIVAIYEYALVQTDSIGEYGDIVLDNGGKLSVQSEDTSENPVYKQEGVTFTTKDGRIIRISKNQIGLASLLRRVDGMALRLREEIQNPDGKESPRCK